MMIMFWGLYGPPPIFGEAALPILIYSYMEWLPFHCPFDFPPPGLCLQLQEPKRVLMGTSNRESQEYSRNLMEYKEYSRNIMEYKEYSRNIKEYKDLGSYVPIIFLLYTWGSLFGVPSKVPLKPSQGEVEGAEPC